MCCTLILSQQDGAPFFLHVYTSIPLLFCLYINFFPHKMVILLRFMNTHGHHAAARKENQLQTMRGALGLDAESDVEPGELVPRKQGTMMRLAARPVGRVKHECNLDADYDLDLRKSEK
jgi:hypothetical protein